MRVVREIDIESWSGPFAAACMETATPSLEDGLILFTPHLGFAVEPTEQRFLDPAIADGKAKNISYDPETGACHGVRLKGGDLVNLTRMIARFSSGAEQLARDLLPRYAANLIRARTSFRPAAIGSRRVSSRKDDRRLHVDAFPSRPTGGLRILRVFSNVNPAGQPRIWQVGEPFEDFARRFLPKIKPRGAASAWLLRRLGGIKANRSPYDRYMLALHDGAKADRLYQAEAPRAEIAFPASASWIVFSDQVLHAALGGQYLLEQTFHLPVAAMAEQRKSPLRVLERLTGRSLAPAPPDLPSKPVFSSVRGPQGTASSP